MIPVITTAHPGMDGNAINIQTSDNINHAQTRIATQRNHFSEAHSDVTGGSLIKRVNNEYSSIKPDYNAHAKGGYNHNGIKPATRNQRAKEFSTLESQLNNSHAFTLGKSDLDKTSENYLAGAFGEKVGRFKQSTDKIKVAQSDEGVFATAYQNGVVRKVVELGKNALNFLNPIQTANASNADNAVNGLDSIWVGDTMAAVVFNDTLRIVKAYRFYSGADNNTFVSGDLVAVDSNAYNQNSDLVRFLTGSNRNIFFPNQDICVIGDSNYSYVLNGKTEARVIRDWMEGGILPTKANIDYILLDTLFDFGNVPVNKTDTMSSKIINTGNGIMVIDSIVNRLADYMLLNPSAFPLNLNPGDSSIVKFRFAPSAETLRADTAKIYSNANIDKNVILKGRGTAPALPHIWLSEDTLNYHVAQVGDSAVDTVLVSNTGDDNLRLDQVSDNSNVFHWRNPFPLPLAVHPGDTIPVIYVFKPTSVGYSQGILSFLSNDSLNPTANVILAGECGAGVAEDDQLPEKPFAVSPNPFFEHVRIGPAKSARYASICDIAGRTVRKLTREDGNEYMEWNGTDNYGKSVSPGLYFVKLENSKLYTPIKLTKLNK